jgi:hypothetical protein
MMATTIATIALLVGASACDRLSAGERGGCSRDADCKGNRICVNGSCQESASPAPSPLTGVDPGQLLPRPAQAAGFEILRFDPQSLGADIRFEGNIVAGAAFRDRLGDNTVLLCRNAGNTQGMSLIRLRAYHYLRDAGGTRLLREVKDGDQPCEFSDVTGFASDSLRVGDQDADGTGEISFAYTVGCTNDPSPQAFKLLVLEGGEKYILRGQTRVMGQGGSFAADPPLASWPAALSSFAQSEWQRVLPGR